MGKGQHTKATIIRAATEIAARDGLEGLTIGALADRTGMSKSGVFAHFGSREDLQLAVLQSYESFYINEIRAPALKRQRGLPRLIDLVDRWLAYTARGARDGCILVSAAFEYHSRPGAVRDALVAMVSAWQAELATAIRQSVDSGELCAETDVDDLVFGLNGIVLAVHHDARLLEHADAYARGRQAFRRLLLTSPGVDTTATLFNPTNDDLSA